MAHPLSTATDQCSSSLTFPTAVPPQTGRNVVHGSDSPENGERETGALYHMLSPAAASIAPTAGTQPTRCRAGARGYHSQLTLSRIALSCANAVALCRRVTPLTPPRLLSPPAAALWFAGHGIVEWEAHMKPWLVE